jgi:hypothetical protein
MMSVTIQNIPIRRQIQIWQLTENKNKIDIIYATTI